AVPAAKRVLPDGSVLGIDVDISVLQLARERADRERRYQESRHCRVMMTIRPGHSTTPIQTDLFTTLKGRALTLSI
ncbi:MAG TPA: hypothetical protein PKH39_04885, partial [Woeseiaceae bacterium]|nr:hypothetical protein [Woeseiaceae bacterium]